jgi:hypothetical protein
VRVKGRLSAGALRALVALSELVPPETCATCAAEPEEAIALVVYRHHCSSKLECRIFNIFSKVGLEMALTPLSHV